MSENKNNFNFKVTLANEEKIAIQLPENDYTKKGEIPFIEEKLNELTTIFTGEIDKLELNNCNISKYSDSRTLTAS